MKDFLRSLIFIGTLCLGTSASAVEIQTWFTLGGTAQGTTPVCVDGCTGSLTIDLGQAAPGGTANQFVITDIDIELDSTPQLAFTSIFYGSTATVVDGIVEAVNFALTTADWHFLTFSSSFDGTGYWILGGPLVNSKGSAVAVPEPTSIALLGAGLIGLGLARRRKSDSSAV